MKKTLITAAFLGVFSLSVIVCYASQDLRVWVNQPDTQLSHQIIEDGKVLVSGRVPSEAEIKEWLS